jgi:putative DeoR family transcriptional regulator (stage III sporulation protein D)
MNERIAERVLNVGLAYVENESTIRKVAKKLKVSKSTVHKDLRERLPKLNPSLYREAEEILIRNTEERTIRGGQATREYWEKRRGDLLG